MRKQPWLRSASFDGPIILAAPFLAVLIVAVSLYLWPDLGEKNLSPIAWLILVLAVDVSHVYASIYRTVLSPKMWADHKKLLIVVPIIAYAAGFFAYAEDPMIFWRLLAYTAVFHFIRQPYGLFMLYKRGVDKDSTPVHRLDQITIYATSLYPIILWHLDPSREFSWFLTGDFAIVDAMQYRIFVDLTAGLIFTSYILKEIYYWRKKRWINIPKNAVALGTGLSFGFGILYWNNDFAFTVTNVLSHGVAYMGLVWLTDARQMLTPKASEGQREERMHRLKAAVLPPLIFLLSLLILAYLEEGLWDTLVWKEYGQFFQGFGLWFDEADPNALRWLIPLLALPQVTHYIWDGFIWRKKASPSTLNLQK